MTWRNRMLIDKEDYQTTQEEKEVIEEKENQNDNIQRHKTLFRIPKCWHLKIIGNKKRFDSSCQKILPYIPPNQILQKIS